MIRLDIRVQNYFLFLLLLFSANFPDLANAHIGCWKIWLSEGLNQSSYKDGEKGGKLMWNTMNIPQEKSPDN